MRIMLFGSLYWGPLILGNYHFPLEDTGKGLTIDIPMDSGMVGTQASLHVSVDLRGFAVTLFR